MPLEQVGTFKGVIKDYAVSETNQQKLPQLVATILATDWYNEKEDQWDNWREFEDQILTAYLILVHIDPSTGEVKKCFTYEQVMDATGWDGETYSGLAALDLQDRPIQFRVIQAEYKGQTRFKVNRVADVDAELGLRKLSDKDLAVMDSKFAVASTKPPATTATPKGAKKSTVKATAKAGAQQASAPKAAPKAAPTTKEAMAPERPVEPCNQDDAWVACIEANKALDKPVPTEVLTDYWESNRDEIAADPTCPTDLEHGQIKNAVLNDLSIPF